MLKRRYYIKMFILRFCRIVKLFLSSQHTPYLCGIALALFILSLDIDQTDSDNIIHGHSSWTQTGDYIYHRKTKLGIDHSTYAKSLIKKLLVKVIKDKQITTCQHYSSEVFDRVHMQPREAGLFHSIGDSNLHVISAYLDNRSFDSDVRVIRILAAGLYPFPQDRSLFCNYKCGQSVCSSVLTGAVIVAGSYTDYPPAKETKSLMDAYQMVCAVPSNTLPSTVHITRTECGFSHNYVNISLLENNDKQQPKDKIGVCVLPLDVSTMNNDDKINMNLWIRYLNLQGFDGVHLYLYNQSKNEIVNKYFKLYESSTRRNVFVNNWDVIGNRLETVISTELAKNHCMYANMKTYKYIFILPFQMWFILPKYLQNVRQIIESGPFSETLNRYGGMRVQGCSNHHGLVVQSNMILLTAANHFIPISRLPSYRLMDPGNLYLDYFNKFIKDPDNSNTITDLNKSLL